MLAESDTPKMMSISSILSAPLGPGEDLELAGLKPAPTPAAPEAAVLSPPLADPMLHHREAAAAHLATVAHSYHLLEQVEAAGSGSSESVAFSQPADGAPKAAPEETPVHTPAEPVAMDSPPKKRMRGKSKKTLERERLAALAEKEAAAAALELGVVVEGPRKKAVHVPTVVVTELGERILLKKDGTPMKKRGGRRKRAEEVEVGSDGGAAAFALVEEEPLSRLRPARPSAATAAAAASARPKSTPKEARAIEKQYDNVYLSLWKDMSRKDAPKVARLLQQAQQAKLVNLRKTAVLAAREAKRWQVKTNKSQKDLTTKARRAMREMLNFWKRNEREEKELRKRAEKELVDRARKEEEAREAKRASRKLNFLITQTELYSHFIGKKIKTEELENEEGREGARGSGYDVEETAGAQHRDYDSLDWEVEGEAGMVRQAAANAQTALEATRARARAFNGPEAPSVADATGGATTVASASVADATEASAPPVAGEEDTDLNFQNPTSFGDITIAQPKLLSCTLKEYQVKGLNWLANLYDQGINGILADEMGLGKTVQLISVLAYLAETHNIWGPYLVVLPASTLHNWQQEIAKFVPDFKVLPYWGTAKDRKVLRKFWDRKNVTYTRDAPFHVMVTSYQMVVADAQYFQRMKWQYMILDEAQAIKSSSSSRWKSLLSFQCRNRLLLTGTPIQNNMQELWALLHFIMPSLFDSHDEFSDWFAKDIELHATSGAQLNEQQLRRLHVILKPFMLRRVKKHVQSELGDKIEVDVYCPMTTRQRRLYQLLRLQVSVRDLLERARGDDAQSLMNLVMQFRKVCNHPDLFERVDTRSPFAFVEHVPTASLAREAARLVLEVRAPAENPVRFSMPKVVYRDRVAGRAVERDIPLGSPAGPSPYRQMLSDVSAVSRLCGEVQARLVGGAVTPRERAVLVSDGETREPHGETREPHDVRLEGGEPHDVRLKGVSGWGCLDGNEPHLVQLPTYPFLPPAVVPPALAPPVLVLCSDASFAIHAARPIDWLPLVPMPLLQELALLERGTPLAAYPPSNGLAARGVRAAAPLQMPSMERFITDSGKLARLDALLTTLKANNHRVLLYFQMTRMMDLMEEYLTYRQHRHIRLDGSSKLGDRRDLVHDWQTKPEIFVFILLTRAGGLGINLTAADTVIFYDSDWNPTIDLQAMDRAHRLGQTRQVTVYRMLVRGTIEERMRDRAKQKEHVQQVVMEGKGGRVERDEKREVAMWLLDDEALEESQGAPGSETPLSEAPLSETPLSEAPLSVSAAKRLASEAPLSGPAAKRGRPKKPRLEDMYHEGEGEFEDREMEA